MFTCGTVINVVGSREDRCDIRVWSGECNHDSLSSSGEKYMCDICREIPNLNHEVRHEGFPHIMGDTHYLH